MKHIAILRQPFYDMILRGEKTIESRWSMNKIAPFNKVQIGDIIYLKISGRPITAKAEVQDVKFFSLTPKLAGEILEKYGERIGVKKFKNIEKYLNKRYLTLIWLNNVERIEEIKPPKSNGAGWIIMRESIDKN